MQAQYQEFISGRDEHPVIGPGFQMPIALVEEEPQVIGVVAVAAGQGMMKVFKSLGATAVVQGGQTMNPSTADILDALTVFLQIRLLSYPITRISSWRRSRLRR
jgi:dihydroxyacetone kinase-like predicted kinase